MPEPNTDQSKLYENLHITIMRSSTRASFKYSGFMKITCAHLIGTINDNCNGLQLSGITSKANGFANSVLIYSSHTGALSLELGFAHEWYNMMVYSSRPLKINIFSWHSDLNFVKVDYLRQRFYWISLYVVAQGTQTRDVQADEWTEKISVAFTGPDLYTQRPRLYLRVNSRRELAGMPQTLAKTNNDS